MIAHQASGRVLADAAHRPVACGMWTGFGGSEARVAVTNDGTVVYEPAVLTPGLAGTGYAPGAPGPRPQTQTSEGGLAVSGNDGATWRFVKPGGVTWTPQDDQLYVDRTTGRIFWYAMQPNPFPQDGGVDLIDQIPLGDAGLLVSPDDGKTWFHQALPGYIASENPRFTTARPTLGQAKPSGYPNVAYWCGNNALFVYVARECWRSLDGGRSWNVASVLFTGGPSQRPECEGKEEEFNAGDGNYPQAAPDGSLYVMVQCGGHVFLARSTDEAATWPILDMDGKPLEIPATDELRMDPRGNLYSMRLDGNRLLLRVSRDRGRTWSLPLDATAPGVANINQWFVAVRDPGQVAFAYFGQRDGQSTYDAYMTMTRDALDRDPVFFSAIVNDPRKPLLAAPGTPAKDDYIGVDLGPDGSAWGAFYADCPDAATDPVCGPGGDFNFEADRAFAGRLVWP
ncbi:MAG: sialidase family protein [Actinomycetota bacterium]